MKVGFIQIPVKINIINMQNFKEQLEQEVTSSGMNIPELRTFVWNGKEEEEVNKRIFDVISTDSTTRFRPHFYDSDRKEGFTDNLRRITRLRELAEEGKIPYVDSFNYGSISIALSSLHPLSVHHGMFESIMKVLGSDEQIKKYWDDIRAYNILGCYAQTEIGTGSNVQGLQTQAIYDEETEEFVINTPDITAAKFWPGDLGKMANHAVVFARLMIKDESYGIHAFFFRIKDQDSHQPLKGVEVGDIGTKYGYFAKDNGYMLFKKFRVPRTAILSKYVNVTKDGMIEIKGDPRVAYGTMLFIRVQLLTLNWQILFSNLAKSFRYALKRTQFKSINNSEQERKILDYQATKTHLIPALAFTYANTFMSKFCVIVHDQMVEGIKKEDFKIMNDLHVLVSCLKAHYMQESIDILFQMRECAGGHGYLNIAGYGPWLECWSANVTLEGDAYVLYQQTTKKLVKMVSKITQHKDVNK